MFDNPQFIAWVKNVEDFNAKNPEKPVSMIATLAAHYDDKVLAQMLEAAKKVEQTKTLATKLQADQMRGWLEKGKTPDSIYKVMGLDLSSDEGWKMVFTIPEFTTWFKYVAMFNKQNPSRQESAIDILIRLGYHHINIMEMIKMTQQHPHSGKIAKIIQAQLVKAWLRWNKLPVDVFQLLHLQNIPGGSNILAHRDFRVWAKFLDDFNKKYPDKKTNMLRTFLTHYSDEDVAKMLAKAEKNPFTKELASSLQMPLLNTWVRELKSPAEVAKLLDGGTSNALLSPLEFKANDTSCDVPDIIKTLQ